MDLNSRNGLVRLQGLPEQTLLEIEQLARICHEHDQIEVKLNWGILRKRAVDQNNDFAWYEEGMLVGFLPLFSFMAHEAEISGIVHPQYRRRGIFSALFQEAWQECQRRGITQMLLIIPHESQSGQEFAQRHQARYHHSEYKMALREPVLTAFPSLELSIRHAREEDIPALNEITAISFDPPQQEVNWYTKEVLEDPTRSHSMALVNGEAIGKVDVELGEGYALIYGFGVLPAFRRRGYGRQLLAHTIRLILESGRHKITLEVVTDNERALSLYTSCGFECTGRDDYYVLDVEKTTIP